MKGGEGSNWPHPHPTLPEKSTLKKPSLIRVEMSPFLEEITVQVRVVLWSCLSPHPVFLFFIPISTLIKLVPFNFYLFEDFLKFFYNTPSIAYI